MKSKRFKETPRDTASKGHVKVFNFMKELFPLHELYQEYPYSRILGRRYRHTNPKQPDAALLKYGNTLHADIYDPTLSVIIEIQGEQHYFPVRWSSNEPEEEALSRHESIIRIDNVKRRLAKEAMVKLIEIKYDELKTLTKEILLSKLTNDN